MTKTRNCIIALTIALTFGWTAASPAPQETADAAVQRVYDAVEQGRLEVAWQALPASYQADIRNLLQTLAPESEAELEMWNQSMGVMNKLLRLVRDKGDYILGHPMLAAQVQDASKHDEIRSVMTGIADLLEILFSGPLADPQKMASLDIDAYLADVGPRLYKIFRELEAKSSGGQTKGKTVIALVSSEGDSARLSFQEPGEEAEEKDFVRVEGKWLPKEMVDGWDEQMEQVQGTLEMAALQAQDEEMLAQQRMMLGMLDQSLDQMLAASTQEEFTNAAQALVGAVMMAAAAAESQGQ